jgi:hypothetical protein
MLLCFCLTEGCAHRPEGAPVVSGPVDEIEARAIAAAAVKKAEKWKKIDSVAREISGGWKVYVLPIPCRGNSPYVWVTVNADGKVIHYERGKTML